MDIIAAIKEAIKKEAPDIYSKKLNHTIAIRDIKEKGVDSRELFTEDWEVLENTIELSARQIKEAYNNSVDGLISSGSLDRLLKELGF